MGVQRNQYTCGKPAVRVSWMFRQPQPHRPQCLSFPQVAIAVNLRGAIPP